MKPLFVARLVGTQAEMGAQHGRLVAEDAARLYTFYKTMPERTLAGAASQTERWIAGRIASTWQGRLLRERPKDLAARSRAFADAVADKMPDYDARGVQRTFAVMDSMQNCVSIAARMQLGPFARPVFPRQVAAAVPACSTLIAWGRTTEDGELLFGRNFDFPGIGVWDAAPAFIVCAPDRGQRYGFFTTKGADTAVVTVINEAGIVVAPHTRWHRDVTWGGAMIVDVIHDIARRAETLADAIAIVKERGASSSWGIAIGSAREKTGCVVEVAGKTIDVVRPRGEYLTCTNRYRTETLQAGELAGSRAWGIHSDRREARLRQLVDNHAPLVAQDIARFLGDRHDASAPERKRRLGAILAQPLNVHCVVAKPSAREAWVGIDQAPVCEGAWSHVVWDWDGPQGAEPAGITASTLADFVAMHDEATVHVREAIRVYETSHDTAAARTAMERAIAVDPDDPSLRLAAAWLALEENLIDRALVHIHAGLALETDPYRKGQFLLWGVRASRKSDPALARRWTDDLARLDGDGVDELRVDLRRRRGSRPHANLLLVDAY